MVSLTQPSQSNRRLELQAEFIGKAITPLTALIPYLVYRLIRYGGEAEGFPHTYVLLGAAVLSVVVVGKYGAMVFQETAPRASVVNALKSFAALLPYVLSLYVIGYLGIMPLIGLVSNGFSFGTLMFGMFWCAVGYRLTYTMWLLSEVGRRQLPQPL